ncbi:MAG TPA: c-type cytochrome [Caulobacteraceae bacterium]|jgi:cytochrome c
MSSDAFYRLFAVALAAVTAGSPALAADATKGAALVQARCNTCHSPEAGQGPDLTGVVGRKAGTAQGFPVSAALKGSGIVWTPADLDAFLADPGKRVPGTSMPNPYVNAADRADIVAYLATLKP